MILFYFHSSTAKLLIQKTVRASAQFPNAYYFTQLHNPINYFNKMEPHRKVATSVKNSLKITLYNHLL